MSARRLTATLYSARSGGRVRQFFATTPRRAEEMAKDAARGEGWGSFYLYRGDSYVATFVTRGGRAGWFVKTT